MRNNLVACFGEPLIGFYESKDTSLTYKNFYLTLGGDTSNVALQLSKFGVKVKFITKLGNDIFGEYILKIWNEWDIDISDVIISDKYQTGIYFTIFEDKIRHRFIYKRENSASSNYTVKDAENVNLDNIKIFHLSSISQAISKNCLEASFYFMEKCKRNNINISYDSNYRKLLWSENYYKSIAIYTIKNFVDILSLNIDEAYLILGKNLSYENVVKTFLDYGPNIVALKLGEEGGLIGNKDKIVFGRSYKVEVVDTVGAGDAFTASIIFGLLKNWDLEKIIDFANYCASAVCKSIGSTQGQLKHEDIKTFLDDSI